MEMRRGNMLKRWVAFCTILLMLSETTAQAQAPVRSYSVKNGKMFIALGKNLSKDSLESFIIRYELTDLDLNNFLKTGSADSLSKLGWKVDINNGEVCVISKPLFSIDNINDPGDKIIFTQKADSFQSMSGDQGKFGYNRFKNKLPFAVSDSTVRFFLRGNTDAVAVNLAGNFNSWNPAGIMMKKADSGWIADVKVGAGKHLYKFIIDGNWRVDKDNTNVENDGMGNDNSVYYKPNYTFNLAGYDNARKVVLSGSFNGWNERTMQMQKTATGWTLPVFLSAGTHTYRFIVDGKWLTDPVNPDKLPNEFNDFNSVIRLGKPYVFAVDGFLDAKKVVLRGDFNNWKEDELFMNKTATGWEYSYTLGPGNYEYQVKVDGKLIKEDVNNWDNRVLVIEPNFTFRLKGFDNAKKIFVAGDFNNWVANSFAMKRVGDEWVCRVHLYKGKQRYKFIVDGEWILDPGNKLWEQNEHNTGNSILWFGQEQ